VAILSPVAIPQLLKRLLARADELIEAVRGTKAAGISPQSIPGLGPVASQLAGERLAMMLTTLNVITTSPA